MLNYKVFKTERVNMTNRFNYIKKGTKYIIGAAVLTASLGSVSFGLDKDVDGYYTIGSSADFKEFAGLINSGKEPDACAKLMNDIVFNEGVIENGKLSKGKSFEECEPIGRDHHEFKGKFLGNNKKIIGFYIDEDNADCQGLFGVNEDNADCQGLFGIIGEGSEVKDIEVSGSYIKGRNRVGGIAGVNKGKIENCSTTNSIVKGKDYVGGNVGKNMDGTIEKCENSASISGTNHVGGNVGVNEGEIEGECKNSGAVTGKFFVGGNVGMNRGKIKGECKNSGAVTGKFSVGGNVGYNPAIIEEKCENSGEVKGDESVGGNVGDNERTISGKCENSAPISGKNHVGGNIGVNSNGRINEQNLHNTGTVNGKSADTAEKIG